jgi:DNA repair photolyase
MTKSPPQKRLLEAVVADLFAPLLKVPIPFSGYRLLSWDAEQGLCLNIVKGDTVLLIELEERNDRLDCYARTSRFNICARRQFEMGITLTGEQRQVIDYVVNTIRLRERRLPVFDRPTTDRKSQVREILVDQVLIPEGRGHYYINPYSGCMIGCDFCYVAVRADYSRKLEGLPAIPWGRYVDVKVNAAEVLREEVRRHAPGFVRMSPILTDPYQSLEKHYRITRQCLEVMLESDFRPGILTRAARVVEDIDLLTGFKKAAVGFSIPSDDDRYRLIFEPGADPVEDRLEALRRCHEAGLATYAVIQPLLPMNVERLADLVAPYVSLVRLDRMHFIDRVWNYYTDNGLEYAAEEAFFEDLEGRLKETFRERGILLGELDDMAPLLSDEA